MSQAQVSLYYGKSIQLACGIGHGFDTHVALMFHLFCPMLNCHVLETL